MAGVAAVLVLVLLVSGVFSRGGASKPRPKPTAAPGPALATPPGRTRRRRGAGHAMVAVLNGTSVAGLARTVANRLARSGYKIGAVTNAPTHQHPSTLVSYAGSSRAQADAVAQAINVSPSAVQALDAPTRAAAHGAPVVVTVGADSSH